MEGQNCKNMARAMKSNPKILMDYLAEKKMPKLEDKSDDELPGILKTFYSNLRTINGEVYTLQSLKCIRAGINRHTKEVRNLDIIHDSRYAQSNEMFRGVAVKSKQQGKGCIRPTQPILPEDVLKIGQYFNHGYMNRPHPKKVQRCVLFYVLYFFCQRWIGLKPMLIQTEPSMLYK